MVDQLVIGQTSPRYENKYTLDIDRGGLKPFIDRCGSMLRPVFYKRQVNNLYFDDHSFSLYQANLVGQTTRYKVRLRWYGELVKPIAKPQLEIKVKDGDLIYKRVYGLTGLPSLSEMSPKIIKEKLIESDVDHLIKQLLKTMKPSYMGSYMREYFLTVDGKVRMTIDSELVGRRQIFDNSFCWPRAVGDEVIVELKYKSADMSKASSLIQSFPVTLMKHSKYVYGMEADTP